VNLVLFTPASRASAIARASVLVVRALRACGHRVAVVRTEHSPYLDSVPHGFDCDLLRWDDARSVEREARSCDAVIHQVGNSYDFHRGSLEWLPELAGVVCLHDFFLGHLFWGWAEAQRERAKDILGAWYDRDLQKRYFSFSSAAEFIEGTHQEAPMVEWVASMADGVVTHSSWGLERVLASCGGPVDVVPLPYDAPGATAAEAALTRARKFTLLTVGHINPNKCVDSVIRAIGASRSVRAQCEYHLVGRIEPDMLRDLTALAASLGVTLVAAGEVDDRSLELAIRQADAVCCLRLPALEAASASAIEAMLYGKPLLVMDVGFYRDLPGDCVRKIDPRSGIGGIQREIEHLFHHPDARRGLGDRAAAWASATFSAEGYVHALIAICERSARCAPAMRVARAGAETLARWGAAEEELANPYTLDAFRFLTGSPRRGDPT
jgi:glycosyltransferase involved in cell wall biosynthesis